MEKNIRVGYFFDIGQVWASGGSSAGCISGRVTT